MAMKTEFKPEESLAVERTTLQAVKVGYTSAEQNAFAVMNKASKAFDKAILQ